MADNKSAVGKSDGERVNVNEPYELADWAEKLGVNADKVRAAVLKVGSLVKDVRKELRA